MTDDRFGGLYFYGILAIGGRSGYHIFKEGDPRSLCGTRLSLGHHRDEDKAPVTGQERFGRDDCRGCFKAAGIPYPKLKRKKR